MFSALRKCSDKIPARLVVAIMCFFACWCTYMLRLNLSVAIIAMVKPLPGKESKGNGDGAVYPALHCLIARWAPPEEKGRFIWSLLGGTFGTVISFPVSGVLVEEWGWRESFYVFGGVVLFFSIFWIWLIRDSPDKHPRISEKELTYIEERIGTNVERNEGAKTRSKLPILRIMTSLPFLALLLCHYGNLWGLFFLLTLAPKFMSDILDFDLKKSGGLSSLPYLARVGFGFVFSAVGDYMVKNETFSRTTIRKIFVVFSHLASGALMFLIGYMDEYLWLTVLMMTLSLGMNGAATVSNLTNHHDLAPNFAGSLYGIMNGIGVTSGFIAPMISGRILEKNNGLYEWRILFIIGALFYIITGVIFIIFGSGNIQSWNTPKATAEDSQPEEQGAED
ncbi:putative inorganic phosphate cotransporter isoform X2 [Anabrus simplex]|uniref:putative inorganic phosphate cotransporter isoform X2 n=1 Tax=Anabrus simplex TaxID=316456 RepID=UPI0034DDB0A5